MSPLTAGLIGLFIGATLGIAFMAMLSLNRAEHDEPEDDDSLLSIVERSNRQP